MRVLEIIEFSGQSNRDEKDVQKENSGNLKKFGPSSVKLSTDQLKCMRKLSKTRAGCIPVPYDEKDIFFWVLVLEGLVGVHRTVQLIPHH